MSTTAIRALDPARRLAAWRARAAVESSAETGELRFLLAPLLATRVLIWAATLGALAIFGANLVLSGALDPRETVQPFGSAVANSAFAPAARYDSVWYLTIAHFGYYSRISAAFFPLYPLLLHLGGTVFGSTMVVGVLISGGAMVGAVFVLFLLARMDMGESAARTSVVLLLCFPTSIFLSAVYTESLFLLLTVGAVYAARRERWWVAGLLGALSSATRSTGVLLAPALAVMFLYGPRQGGVPTQAGLLRAAFPGAAGSWSLRGAAAWWRPRFRLEPSVLWLGLVPAGMAAFFAYLQIRHGAAFAPLEAEQAWGRYFAGPFGAIYHALRDLPGALSRVLAGHQHPYGPGDPLGWEAYQLVDLPFLGFALTGLWLCWRRLPFAYFIYALLMIAESLSYPTHVEPLESFSRYVLVAFPVFLAWGEFLASRQLVRRITYGVLSLGLLAFSGLWGLWGWLA